MMHESLPLDIRPTGFREMLAERLEKKYGYKKEASAQPPQLSKRQTVVAGTWGQLRETFRTYYTSVNEANAEAIIRKEDLHWEAAALIHSVVPELWDLKRGIYTVPMTVVELLPVPFAPWWSFGDLAGMLAALMALKDNKPIEFGLKLFTAIVPVIPTQPVHHMIDKYMHTRQEMLLAVRRKERLIISPTQ